MRGKKAIKNIITLLIQNIVLIICGFIVPKLIITTYGSSVNGIICSITQFLAYITLLESGIGPVIKSRLYKPLASKNKKEIKNIIYSSERFFRSIVKIFVIYIIVLCIIYPMIVSKEFDALFTTSLLIIISFSTISEYFFGLSYSLFLQANQETYITVIFRILTTIVNTIVIIVLIKFNVNIILVKLISSLLLTLRPILLSVYVRKKYKLDLLDADKGYKLKNKWDGLSQHIAAVIYGNTDITVLTIFANIVEVSVYSVYALIINGIKNVVSAFTGGVDALFGDMIAKKEKKQLNKYFSMYETIYFAMIVVIFSCTITLIVPFVNIYTSGIKDANYIRPVFAFIIVMVELVHSIRIPYSSITLSAGHFKETMKGAWFEAISNIVISIVLVLKFGLVGVAIGTLFATTVRTIEFNYHASKYILERNIIKSFIKPTIALIESIIIFFIFNSIKLFEITNYFNWLLYAIIVFIISTIIVLIVNLILYKNDLVNLKYVFKNLMKRR